MQLAMTVATRRYLLRRRGGRSLAGQTPQPNVKRKESGLACETKAEADLRLREITLSIYNSR